MKPKINYHYTIPYQPLCCFTFDKKNDIVSEECYKHRVLNNIDWVISNLSSKPSSRQEVIVTNNMINNACLISLQFQIVNKRLIVIANFRSQCSVNGRPHDSEMLRYLSTLVMKGLKLKRFKIYVNVGNYHENKGVLNNYGLSKDIQ